MVTCRFKVSLVLELRLGLRLGLHLGVVEG